MSEIGGSATGVAGTVARGSPVVAGVISGGVLLHGVASGNSQQEFDGTYGLVTLGVAIFQPYIGLGMAIGKVLGDAAAPNDNDPNILEEAALAAPTTQCPATK